jgi:hypothetical protein
VSNPIGQTITVNGRAAVLNAKPESPRVCLSEQQNYICVGVYVSDTGPIPRPIRRDSDAGQSRRRAPLRR